MALGDAWVDIHGNTDPFERDVEQGVRKAAEDAEDEARDAGDDLGEEISEAIGKRLKSSGREWGDDIADALEKGSVRVVARTRSGRFRDLFSGRFVGGIGDSLEREIGRAFDKVARDGPNGPIGRFGQAVADAVGAGFNISGRSPLIAVLIPLLGFLIALITAAVQIVGALLALLAALPAILVAIVGQVGVVYLAFQGMGEAIQGALSAKNAQELNKAIQNLTPSAQTFVRQLLPLRDLFKLIQRLSQEQFFRNLGSILNDYRVTIGPVIQRWLPQLAGAMGRLFREVGKLFTSPEFARFLERVIPMTIAWLDKFGPDFSRFLEGLLRLANTALPLLEDFGRLLGGFFYQLGVDFENLSRSQNFKDFLKSSEDTLASMFALLTKTFEAIGAIVKALDEAGGKELIDELIKGLDGLIFLLNSDAGKKGMEGFVNFLKLMTQVTFGLLYAVILVFGFLQLLFDSLSAFFTWLHDEVFEPVGKWIMDLWEDISGFFTNFLGAMDATQVEAENVVNNLTGGMLNIIKSSRGLFMSAGQTLMAAFARGLRLGGREVGMAAASAAAMAAAYLPHSPAEKGPFSGSGYSFNRGQALMRDFARGILSEIPTLGAASNDAIMNVNFGPGSVRVGFEGAVPTPEQARVTGSAAGQGIVDRITAQRTRLAVRTL